MLRYKVNNTESHRTYHMLQQSSACKLLLCVYFRYFPAFFFLLCCTLGFWPGIIWRLPVWRSKSQKIKLRKKSRKELPVLVIRQSRRRLQISPDFTLQFPCGCKVRKCGRSTYCAAVRAACVVLQVVFHFDCVSYMLHTLNNGSRVERTEMNGGQWLEAPRQLHIGHVCKQIWAGLGCCRGSAPASILSDKLSAAILSGRRRQHIGRGHKQKRCLQTGNCKWQIQLLVSRFLLPLPPSHTHIHSCCAPLSNFWFYCAPFRTISVALFGFKNCIAMAKYKVSGNRNSSKAHTTCQSSADQAVVGPGLRSCPVLALHRWVGWAAWQVS